MTLRSRLTLAFFAIAVIPLSAVTLFSYYSSERALRRAAEQQAASMAAELGRRMEWVTTDLERRMDRVWPMPEEQVAADEAPGQAGGGSAGGPRPPARAGAPPAPAAPQPPDMAGHIAVVLGDAAPMIESLEIMPGAGLAEPAPGAPVRRQLPATLPRSAHPAQSRPHRRCQVPAPLATPLRRLACPPNRSRRLRGERERARWCRWKCRASSKRRCRRPRQAAQRRSSTSARGRRRCRSGSARQRLLAASGEDVRRLTRQAQALEREAARLRSEVGQGTEERGRAQAADAAGRTSGGKAPAAGRPKATTELKGADVNSTVRRDGQEVGRIHARLNMPRLFRAILPPNRRDEGEVAFAIDDSGAIHTRDADKPHRGRAAQRRCDSQGRRHRAVRRRLGRRDPQGPGRHDVRHRASGRQRAARAAHGVAFATSPWASASSSSCSSRACPLAGGMTRNLRTLMQGVQAVAHGDLSTRVPVQVDRRVRTPGGRRSTR